MSRKFDEIEILCVILGVISRVRQSTEKAGIPSKKSMILVRNRVLIDHIRYEI